MGRRRTVNKGYPPHLRCIRGSFYFDHGIIAGKRKYTPLGRDYPMALRKWAELAGEPEIRGTTWSDASRRYRRDILRTVAPKTQDSYTRALDALDKVFGDTALDAITAELTNEYLRRRSVKRTDTDGKITGGPIVAAREVAVLSLVFNLARDWGYTNAANPRYGKRLAKAQRKVYVTDERYSAIYAEGDEILQDTMDLAYQTGLRPSDTLRVRRSDIRDGRLEIEPQKTKDSSGAKVSIEIVGELKVVIDRILARPRKIVSMLLIQRADGSEVTLQMIQRRWQLARAAAGVPAHEAQFRDLRAKAATDIGLEHAQELLAHTSRSTTEGYRRGRVGERVKPVNRRIGKAGE